MKIAAKYERDLADQIEGSLDYIPRLDRIPFHIKREAAERAAKVAKEYLEQNS